MSEEEMALWFVACEIALRNHDDYSTDEACFYGWWQDSIIDAM